MSSQVVVVGAGLGGLRVVEHLRRRGYEGSITMVGAERHPPYDRPPLTKHVLRGERDSTNLWKETNTLDVRLLLDTPALALDPVNRIVHLGEGRQLGYDTAVVATGGRPRTLPQSEWRPGMHVVRTIDDVVELRVAALAAGSAAVVGGGFIGCEVAASLRTIGVQVDLVELLPYPLARVLGVAGGQLVAGLLQDNGVRLHCGVAVENILGTGHVSGVGLTDGSQVSTSELVVGLGIVPDVAWLEGSGLAIGDGILCDAAGRTSAPAVFAIGDAANWEHPMSPQRRRVEHWTTTNDQAKTVAAVITGDDNALLAEVPYFWSDLFDTRIQALGFVDPTDEVRRVEVNGRSVLLYVRDGIVRSVVGFSAPKAVMQLRTLIATGGSANSAEQLLRSL